MICSLKILQKSKVSPLASTVAMNLQRTTLKNTKISKKSSRYKKCATDHNSE